MTYKLNKPNRYSLSLIVSLSAVCSNAALAQQAPVVVKTYGQHIGGNIVYQQQITNNGSRDIVSLSVGLDTDQISPNLLATRARGELDALPLGSTMFKLKVDPASISGPSGWTGSVIQINDGGRYFEWRRPPYKQSSIQPGQTVRFNITVPKYDEAYLTGHFSAGYADGKDPWDYNGVMEKLDTTAPIFTVDISSATLWPPNGKPVSISAFFTAKDDYDLAPDIKLESITANETLESGDIQDAQFGTDDRQFSLVAKRAGTNQAGRIYTITYSATDASGNKTTASAIVTVPHDQGK